MIYDVNIAKRFVQFRKKYVGKSQADVAKVLNLQQSKISRVEAAQTDIGLSDIYPLIKHYKLNQPHNHIK